MTEAPDSPLPAASSPRRRDIDVLRAVAVLQVIFFHFGVPGFGGGFLGVDVFFVISGYLITRKITAKIGSSSFSYLGFLANRARRLVPAFAATLLVTWCAGLLLSTPDGLKSLQREITSASAYLSNFMFWLDSGYFDTEAMTKPLLHTWSLSVEEQFYFLWPGLLLFLPRKRVSGWYLLLGLVSLVATEVALGLGFTSAAFFLFPFRVFEFVLGALIPYWTVPRDRGVKIPLEVGALLLVLLPAALLTERSHFPGLGALPTCLGTAWLIASRPRWLNGDRLDLRLAGWVGKVSYSAYLVHWPLLVFYSQGEGGELGLAEIFLLLGVTLLLSGFSWRFVEQPFLNSRVPILAYLPSIPLTFALMYGLTQVAPTAYDLLHPGRDSLDSLVEELEPRNTMTERLLDSEIRREGSGQTRITVVGDSHAIDGALAIQLAAGSEVAVNIVHIVCDPLVNPLSRDEIIELYSNHTNAAVTPERCEEKNPNLLGRIVREDPDIIVFSERWRTEAVPYLAQTLRILKDTTGAQMVVLGPNQEFSRRPGQLLHPLDSPFQVNREAWDQRVDQDELTRSLREVVSPRIAVFVDKQELVCPETGFCDYLVEDSLTYWDRSHWTEAGLRLFGQRLVEKLRELNQL